MPVVEVREQVVEELDFRQKTLRYPLALEFFIQPRKPQKVRFYAPTGRIVAHAERAATRTGP